MEINKNQKTIKRFWKYVDKKSDNECWNWIGSCNTGGYGKICINRKWIRAHRFSWMLHFGEILKDKPCVLHSCNNRKCVNPNHLYLGTNKDNSEYMVKQNRQFKPQGEKNHMHKLTLNDVKQIRDLEGKLFQKEIAKIFNISGALVSLIHNNKIWN